MAEHEPKTEEKAKAKTPMSPKRKRTIIWSVIAGVIVVSILTIVYFYVSSQTVYIDESVITAPIIQLSPNDSGVLNAVYVKEGDEVAADAPVALVGDEVVTTNVAGIIVSVNDDIGTYLNTLTGQGTVVSMIDPTELRVVGYLDENKGLADVEVGDTATFTVDAFGSEKFQGVVDEVSPTSRATDVVFDISDERPTNQFDVYVRFDPTKYPQLKNGMSARIWIYKK